MLALSNQVDIESLSVLAFHPHRILDGSLTDLTQLNTLVVVLPNESVSLEERNWRLDINLTRVTLSTKVELNNRDAQELSATSDVSGHWHFSSLL